MESKIKSLRKKSLALPLLPGVYIMKNANGEIIYIGKAKALKNRVSQYFTNIEHHAEKVRQMVLRVDDFEYIICGSEFEALILENSLIKQNQPKYNILLKDDKGFHYVHVTDEEYPRISAEKQEKAGGKNIGPYNSNYIVSAAVEEAKKTFGLPLCKKTFHSGMKKSRPCLNYFIGLCRAPCAGEMSKEEYLNATENAVDLIKHGADEIIEKLRRQMNEAADKLEFEKAAYLRDRINAVGKIKERQKVVMSDREDMDIIACIDGANISCFEVFRFRDGRLSEREHFFTDTVEGAQNSLSEFITRYYTLRDDLPKLLLLPVTPDDSDTLEQYLTQKAGRKVTITVPQRGELKRLAEMCRTNCAERVAQREGMNIRTTAALDELKTLLGLEKVPEYIESYDISHTAGEDSVAGMVVFKDGKPYKSAYKKFAIQGIGNDDYASMAQVITRRLNEYKKHENDDNSFGILPDLILLDGGAGQLMAVLPVVQSFGVNVPVFGMVKDSHHRTRAIVGTNGEIQIKATRAVFTLVSSIQDEVHRFSVGYHHQKHKKRTLALSLNQIDGIGKTRAAALLKAFGDINKIATAEVEQLAAVDGMTEKSAQAVYKFYHDFGGQTYEK